MQEKSSKKQTKSKPAVITAKKAPAKESSKRASTTASNKSVDQWPKITEGSHLKVITHENGRIELIWDDKALLRDVRNAILSVETKRINYE